MVAMMASYKIAHEEMCKVITRGDRKTPIVLNTLKKYFAVELERGFIEGKMRIMAASFRSAIGEQVRLESGEVKHIVPPNVTAQIWLGKTLYGMREPPPATDMPPPQTDDADAAQVSIDAARRVAFALEVGMRATGKTK